MALTSPPSHSSVTALPGAPHSVSGAARRAPPSSPRWRLALLNMIGGKRLTWGDGLELLGLAAGASLLPSLAIRSSDPLGTWLLWGAPLLLVVWASLRHGLRGGVLVAGVAVAVLLAFLHGGSLPGVSAPLIWINLLGQCIASLLVASFAVRLRRGEDHYRQVMAHLPEVIYSARFRRSDRPSLSTGGLNAEVMLVSAASASLFSCPEAELLGDYERWLRHVHPEDREVPRAAVAQLGRQVQPVICEYRLAEPVRWVRDTLTPSRDAQGRLLGWEGLLRDITEQRALADDLRRITNMLNALIDNLPAGVFFVQEPNGHPILVNARARQLLGQREDLAAGLEHLADVYRLHRPDGTPYPVEELPVFLALRKGQTVMREDIVVHHPDGRRTSLVTWAAPVTLTRGAPSGSAEAAVWVLEDLSALRQAEAARRDAEVRLRAILETMAEGLVVLDAKGTIVDSNTAASAVFGYPPERLRGMVLGAQDWIALREDGSPLPAEEYPSAIVLRMGRPVRNLVAGIIPRTPQSEQRSPKAEEIRWLLVNAMPLGGGSGGEDRAAVNGAVVTYVDLTASIRVQRMLRESEEKYRELVESLPLIVIQADRELRLTYANSALRNISGYDLREIAEPGAWGSLIHPDDMPRIISLAREALDGRSGRQEYRYRAKDGSEKVGLAFVEPCRRPDGVIVGTTTLVIDITRERHLEQELLRAQRLELIGRLSSGIAHDFNNLLSVVLSLTELVSMSLPPDHAAHLDLARIREATDQGAHLANQLLAFSKQRRVATRRIEINRVAVRTLELLRASLPSQVVLKPLLDKEALFIQADETQVQQVLMNLCLNARDAMPKGGSLSVRTERVHRDGDWVLLSVRDSGSGMSEQVRTRLFDPFFSTKEGGTGLGLVVVQQIVESHGGRIEVASEPGQGACFDVWWPYSAEEAQTVG